MSGHSPALLVAGLLVLWLGADSFAFLLGAMADIMATIPDTFWYLLGVAFMVGTILISVGFLIRIARDR